MIKRADASKISRDKATKEQIAENFKRLAVDSDKKVQLKPSLLKIQKTLDGNIFGIIHENKTYYLKYTTKKGSTNPTDFKHLDGLNSTFGIEKHNSFEKAVNKMSFICEAQNNAHKLRLLLEKDENIIDDSEESTDSKETKSVEKPVSSDSTENTLLTKLDTDKKTSTPEAMPTDMGAASEAMPTDMGATPAVDTTQTSGETPAEISDEILGSIGDDATEAPAAAPEGGEEAPAADAAPEGEEADPKKEFQETVGKLGQVVNELQDKKLLDKKDIKNAMNSLITAIGDDFKQLSDKEKESFYQKIKGSSVEEPVNKEEPSTEEEPVEAPAEEEPSTEKLDENILRQLKSESKRLLKEQLKQEIEKRKRNILIESIKRKLI